VTVGLSLAMPIYEYKCTVCSDRLEIEQRITDDALTTLGGCLVAENGEHRLKKVFSSIGISFKGDGFYRNDARGSKPKAPATSSETPASSSSSDAGSTSTSSADKTPSTTSSEKTPAPAAPSKASSSSD
jgi:putative FmdB family regulatory protein